MTAVSRGVEDLVALWAHSPTRFQQEKEVELQPLRLPKVRSQVDSRLPRWAMMEQIRIEEAVLLITSRGSALNPAAPRLLPQQALTQPDRR